MINLIFATDPIQNIYKLLNANKPKSIIFLPDILELEEEFVINDSLFYFLKSKNWDRFLYNEFYNKNYNLREIKKSFSEDFFGSTSYYQDLEKKNLFYNSQRDCIFIFMSYNMDFNVDVYDEIFVDHSTKVGIGYGEAGKKYLSDVLQILTKHCWIENDRKLVNLITS